MSSLFRILGVFVSGLLASVLLTAITANAGELVLKPVEIVETKAVYGRVETRDIIPARTRIGGTLVRLEVSEGDAVIAGQTLGTVLDEKLGLQLRAAEARLRALMAEQSNAKSEFDRAKALLERGNSTQQRVDQLRTQLDVVQSQIAAAEADRAVIVQQSADGVVVAPVAGRILKVPVTRGAVVLPGEQVALVAGGGFFLRLALPERHAAQLKAGAVVMIGEEVAAGLVRGKLAKVFPQIENGRVIADVEVETLGDYFVGARVLVQVPIGMRSVLAVPTGAVKTRSGVDFITLTGANGPREIAVVLGSGVMLPEGRGIEILSGARIGDRVVLP